MITRLIFTLWRFITSSGKFWELIDHTGILVFTGPNGSGKSWAAVAAVLPVLDGIHWACYDIEHRHHAAWREHYQECGGCDKVKFLALMVHDTEGIRDAENEKALCAEGARLILENSTGKRRVYSTVALNESRGVPHPLYVPLRDFQQLLSIEHADVLFDEVAGIADSSGSAQMPVQVTNWLHQLRKRDVRLRVTTPAYARCALPIRQVTQVVVECKSYFPARTKGLLWRPRRVVRAAAYDAFSFDEFIASDGQRDRLRTMAKSIGWVPGSRASETYNTFGQVLQLGHVTDAGMCVVCGGTRAKPSCGCESDLSHVHPDRIQVETVTVGARRVRQASIIQ